MNYKFLLLAVGAFTFSCRSTNLKPATVKSADFESSPAPAGAPHNPVSFNIVSDVDDTVKITDVPDPLQVAWKGLFGKDVFRGMAGLYREMGAQKLVFISGGPFLLRSSLTKLLVSENGFPPADFILRNFWPKPEIRKFKGNALQDLAPKVTGPFVLIGDDTEKDPEAFGDFAASPAGQDRVLAVYIHKVTGRELPPLAVPYFTAFDVALREAAAGRLTADQVVLVGNDVLSAAQDQPDHLFPSYAVCPMDLAYDAGAADSAVLVALKARLPEIVNAYCMAHDGGDHHDATTRFLKFLSGRPD